MTLVNNSILETESTDWSILLDFGQYIDRFTPTYNLRQNDSLTLSQWPTNIDPPGSSVNCSLVQIGHFKLSGQGNNALTIRDVYIGFMTHVDGPDSYYTTSILSMSNVMIDQYSEHFYGPLMTMSNCTIAEPSIYTFFTRVLVDQSRMIDAYMVVSNGSLTVTSSYHDSMLFSIVEAQVYFSQSIFMSSECSLISSNITVDRCNFTTVVNVDTDMTLTQGTTLNLTNSVFSTSGQFSMRADQASITMNNVTYGTCQYSSAYLLTNSTVTMNNVHFSDIQSSSFADMGDSSIDLKNFVLQTNSPTLFRVGGEASCSIKIAKGYFLNTAYSASQQLLSQTDQVLHITLSIVRTQLMGLSSIVCSYCWLNMETVTFDQIVSTYFGITVTGSQLYIRDCHLSELTNNDYLLRVMTSNATIVDTSFAYSSDPLCAYNSNITLDNVKLDNISARQAMVLFSSIVTFKNCTMSRINQILAQPIFVLTYSSVRFELISITACTSGAGLMTMSQSDFTMMNSSINGGNYYRRMIFGMQSTIDITNSKIQMTTQTAFNSSIEGMISAELSTINLRNFTATGLSSMLIMYMETCQLNIFGLKILLSSNKLLSAKWSNVTLIGSNVSGSYLGSTISFLECPSVIITGNKFHDMQVDLVMNADRSNVSLSGNWVSQIDANADGSYVEAETSTLFMNHETVQASKFYSAVTSYNTDIHVSQSTFTLNEGIIFSMTMGNFTLTGSTIKGTTADTAVALLNIQRVQINDTDIITNFASNSPLRMFGGAFYLENMYYPCEFSYNSFVDNEAKASGGVFYVANGDPFLLDATNVLTGNVAEFYGPNYASVKSTFNITNLTENLRNDVAMEIGITVLDGYNNTVSNEVGEIKISIVPMTPTLSNSSYSFTVTLMGGQGIVYLTELVGKPNGSVFQINLSQEDSSLLPLSFQITIPSCSPFQFQGINSSLCQFCPSNLDVYSRSLGRCQSCQSELKHLTQCYQDRVSTTPDFWMYNYDIEYIYQCQPNQCLGSNRCLSGHTGVLCGQCIKSPGINKSGLYCCSSNSIFITLSYIIFIMLVIVGLSITPGHHASIVGILFNYFQSIAILLFPQLNLYIVPLFRISIDFIPKVCPLPELGYIAKVLLSTLMIIVIIVTGTLATGRITFFQRRRLINIQETMNTSDISRWSLFWHLLMMFYGALVFNFFSLALPCRNVGNQTSTYLYMDMDVQCNAFTTTLRVISIGLLGIMLVLLPLYYIYTQYAPGSVMHRHMSEHYKSKHRWWAVFAMYRMASYGITTLLLLYQPELMSGVLPSIMVLITSVQYFIRPYRIKTLNELENMSNLTITMLFIISYTNITSPNTRGRINKWIGSSITRLLSEGKGEGEGWGL
ncbi:hypothetical protein SAMD00019534_112210 [Acytostelium subglobosum LB1]|uniref:hypothetical protein n=1 Tax=Acytostelium subglobosum LB1 TaxID=1410327 RepID=UPI00064513F0|nr:hypothetical protein SAMD00019534_112210 [Acytostelium subglobosum LB1]GAM28045.1 hypothetical protein SAMD00019534_112210 [Acytostelium subglobosum LB1]|eukprot:XP_012749004.1 hypothetical protein SAMD00019534_112210 [Acytostelium subglobosum LB1]